MTKKVALNCYPKHTPTGLGTLCRHMLRVWPEMTHVEWPHPKFDRWVPQMLSAEAQAAFDEADVVVALERPMPGDLFARAKRAGKRTVLVVMHEWLNAKCEWLPHVDLFVCPNRVAVEKVTGLMAHVPDFMQKVILKAMPPLDLPELPHTPRSKIEWFVYSDGWGGTHGRKGWPEMTKALSKLDLPMQRRVTVCSQREPQQLGVVTMRAPSSQAIYSGIDCAVVPSRCEGLGLAVLEPMALGVPVLVTDAEPMNEYIKAAQDDLAAQCLMPVAESRR